MPQPVAERAVTPSRRDSATPGILARALELRWPVTVAFSALFLVVWQACSAASWAPLYLVGPLEIGQAVLTDADRLLSHSAASLRRVLTGFAIGAGLGVLLGVFNATVRTSRELTDRIVAVTYPIPKVALYPAIALILGYTDASRVLLVALMAFYPTYFSVFSGARGVDRALVDLARNLEMSRVAIVARVIVPAAMPRIFTGLRIGLAGSFIMLYVGEVLGGSGEGLGFRIVLTSQTGEYDLLYAAIACFAVLGVVGDRLLLMAGRRLTRGHELEVLGDAR